MLEKRGRRKKKKKNRLKTLFLSKKVKPVSSSSHPLLFSFSSLFMLYFSFVKCFSSPSHVWMVGTAERGVTNTLNHRAKSLVFARFLIFVHGVNNGAVAVQGGSLVNCDVRVEQPLHVDAGIDDGGAQATD